MIYQTRCGGLSSPLEEIGRDRTVDNVTCIRGSRTGGGGMWRRSGSHFTPAIRWNDPLRIRVSVKAILVSRNVANLWWLEAIITHFWKKRHDHWFSEILHFKPLRYYGWEAPVRLLGVRRSHLCSQSVAFNIMKTKDVLLRHIVATKRFIVHFVCSYWKEVHKKLWLQL